MKKIKYKIGREKKPLSPEEIEIKKWLIKAEKTEGFKKLKVWSRKIIKTRVTMIKKCNEFFDWCVENDKPTTIERLALFVWVSKTTLNKYEDSPLFWDVVKEAKQMCWVWIVDDALDKKKSTPIHALYLKNNMWYKDKVEVENVNVTPINIILDWITWNIDSLINKDNKFLTD